MKDKDQQLLWEAYNTGAEGNFIEVATPKGVVLMTREEAKAYYEKQAEEKKAGEKTKNEGAFGGPGGNPDKEGWGVETSDAYTDEDVDGRLREVRSQLDSIIKWIDDGNHPSHDKKGFRLDSPEEKMDELEQLGQSLNAFNMQHVDTQGIEIDDDKARSTAGLPPFSNKEPEDYPRETDRDRYGYPGDQ